MKTLFIFILMTGFSLSAVARESARRVDAARLPFWKQFDNPDLEALVERGLQGNFDVAMATARLEQARAVARQALAPLLPTVSAEGSWRLNAYDRVGSGIEVPAAANRIEYPDTMQNMSAVLKASYLVDIAGRQVATRQAAVEDARAAAEDADAMAVILVTQIVQAYYDVVTANIRIRVLDEQIHNSQQLASVLEMRFQAGTSSALEVLQQRQQLAATLVNRPLIVTLFETSKLQLAALVGDTDTAKLPEFPAQLPDIGEPPDATDTEQAILALPQIRAARLRKAAFEFREKNALRTMMPTLALSGQVGWAANYGNRFDDGETWNIGVVLSVPIYQGGALRAGYHAAKAATRGGENALQSSRVAAISRIQIAAAQEDGQRARLKALEEQQAVATMALEQAKSSYLVGLSDYLNVLAAINALQAVELNVVQTQRDVLYARIQLISALGGEWTHGLAAAEERR